MSNDSDLNSSLRKIAKGAGINFIGLLLASLLGFGSRIILARSLSPAEYGLIALGIALFSITASIGMFGMPGGVTRFVSFYRGKGDLERVRGSIISALRISLPVGLLLAVLLFFGAEWISVHVFNEPNLMPVLRI
ncbi:MAG: oligosaccharide flippase family protein, partial [Archaeoglobaceae archaeon]